jgi:hypothetical protein
VPTTSDTTTTLPTVTQTPVPEPRRTSSPTPKVTPTYLDSKANAVPEKADETSVIDAVPTAPFFKFVQNKPRWGGNEHLHILGLSNISYSKAKRTTILKKPQKRLKISLYLPFKIIL